MRIKRFINLEVFIVLSCVTSMTIAYWHDLTFLLDDALSNEMANYILVLPFLIAYIIYQKRSLLKAQLSLEIEKHENIVIKDIIGASLCISALFLYVYGSFTFNTLEYHMISLTMFVSGCAAILMGIRNFRNLVFPLSFLLLLIIPYREEAYRAGSQLSTLTSTITFKILGILNYPVSLSSTYEAPSIITQTPTGEQVPFIVDIPCASAYSLIGFLVFALFFAYISRETPSRKAGFLLAGLLLVYVMNIVRISVTLVISYWIGVEAAMGLFHLLSGSVLLFLASLLMILIGEKILKIKIFKNEMKTKNVCPLCEVNPQRKDLFCIFCGRFFNPSDVKLRKIDMGKIIALALLFAFVVNVQIPTFSWAQSNVIELDIRELGSSKEAQGFLPLIEGYEPRFVYRDQRFERISKQDASLLYVYNPQESSDVPLFVSVEVAGSYSRLHQWEICLYVVPSEGGNQIVDPILTRDIQIIENPSFLGRLFVFEYVNSGRRVMILYWYERLPLNLGTNWANKHVKTSIIAYLPDFGKGTQEMRSLNDYTELENKLVSTAKRIITYWEPVKAWSAFVIALAGWGQNLAVTTMIASSSIVIIFHHKRWKEEWKKAQLFYKQLTWHSTFSEEEREILNLLETMGEVEKAALIDLAKIYEEKTKRKTKPGKLVEIVNHLEKLGLLKKEIVNEENKPRLLWKISKNSITKNT